MRESVLSGLASPRARLLALGAALVAAAVAVPLVGIGRGDVQRLVRGAGIAAPVAFVALYAGLTVLLFPGSVITAAGGLVFGAVLGTLLSVIGAIIGAAAAFFIGRRLGREQVEEIAGKRFGGIDRWLERHGLLAVLYLRLVPVIPFNALNYGAGFTGILPRDYLVGTTLGILPATFAYAAVGDSLDDPLSPEFIGAVALVLVLAVAGPFINRWLRRRGKGAPAPSGD